VLVGGYGDIALHDFRLLVGAVALAGLASAFPARAAANDEATGRAEGSRCRRPAGVRSPTRVDVNLSEGA
jgi:hypothetical protein